MAQVSTYEMKLDSKKITTVSFILQAYAGLTPTISQVKHWLDDRSWWFAPIGTRQTSHSSILWRKSSHALSLDFHVYMQFAIFRILLQFACSCEWQLICELHPPFCPCSSPPTDVTLPLSSCQYTHKMFPRLIVLTLFIGFHWESSNSSLIASHFVP